MKPQKYGSKKAKISIKRHKIAALLCGAALLFFGCVNDIETIKAFSSTETLPVIQAENYETTFTDSGVVRFFLKTPELLRFESEGQSFVEFPQGLELVKYDNNRQIISRITARYAKQFVKDNRWEAKNDVVAVNMAGDTLKTEHLIWDERNGKIYSEQYVKIVRPDQIITGIGFESDQSMQNWRIKNPRGTIYVQVNRSGPPGEDTIPGSSRILQPLEIQP
jgi:LPS export ABC transporter protein LptC